jgi:hypothetical protein
MLNFCGIVVAILKMETGRTNFYRSPFSKWPPQYCTNSTLSDFNAISYVGRLAAILKMVIGRNFSMLGINSGHHYLPTYQILMISGNVEFLPPIFYTVFWHKGGQSHILRGSKRVEVTIESYRKVAISYINVDNF